MWAWQSCLCVCVCKWVCVCFRRSTESNSDHRDGPCLWLTPHSAWVIKLLEAPCHACPLININYRGSCSLADSSPLLSSPLLSSPLLSSTLLSSPLLSSPLLSSPLLYSPLLSSPLLYSPLLSHLSFPLLPLFHPPDWTNHWAIRRWSILDENRFLCHHASDCDVLFHILAVIKVLGRFTVLRQSPHFSPPFFFIHHKGRPPRQHFLLPQGCNSQQEVSCGFPVHFPWQFYVFSVMWTFSSSWRIL